MYPHERSLVAKMEGKPFVLLGVNSDDNRDALKLAMEKEKITWRSWFQGSTSGPISDEYQIEGWPTLFLIDAEGIIRQKWVGSPDEAVLDQLIDAMVLATPAS